MTYITILSEIDMSGLIIRDATIEDAQFVGWAMLTALDLPVDGPFNKPEVWRRTDILYSWKRARIAQVDGVPVGCLISYPGEEYELLRFLTWKLIFGETDEDARKFESETFPGEYYLDSLAVLPEYRRRGIGKALLLDGIAKGYGMGFNMVTLIVDVDKPSNKAMYERLGFVVHGEMLFFGHYYYRMHTVLPESIR